MEKISIKKLKSNPNNPRQIKDENFKKLVQSIKDFPEMMDIRSDYHYQHEPILYGWKPGKHYFTSDRTKTTVFDYKKPMRNAEHPTMKPVELWSELIGNSSRVGDLCYDSFLGSGTTMVASHQLKRKCYGMELDPKYCQVIIDRMKKLDPSIEIKKL